VTACRYIRRVLFYHDYTTLDFLPDTFVDITDVLKKKQQLLALHKSQVLKKYPTGLDMLENVSARASYYGFLAKIKYAEGFKPLRNLVDF
jgi:LmbE family N-acetylglucosaminyl deacetylase